MNDYVKLYMNILPILYARIIFHRLVLLWIAFVIDVANWSKFSAASLPYTPV